MWAAILPPRTIIELKRLAETPPERFRIADDLWARVVYDFALGHHLKAMPHDHLFGALVPLYLGWLASFMLDPDTGDRDSAEHQDRSSRHRVRNPETVFDFAMAMARALPVVGVAKVGHS